MGSDFKGCLVYVECENISYEGVINDVDLVNQTITLQNQLEQITISSRDITNLKILEKAPTENNVLIPHSQSSAFQPLYNNPTSNKISENCIELAAKKKATELNKKKHIVPKKSDNKKRHKQKDEDCFGSPLNDSILSDFDFEKNLALFNKKAVFDEINATTNTDCVRLVDHNKRNQAVPKYRHDENILQANIQDNEQILLPHSSEQKYYTDNGLVIPCIDIKLRERLNKTIKDAGFSTERVLDMFGRSSSEMIVQLLGGSHRFTPQNSHQKPKVVILCGSHHQGTQAINCGRFLAIVGIDVSLLVSPIPFGQHQIEELELFKLSGGIQIDDVRKLVSQVDLIILAIESHSTTGLPIDSSLVTWTKSSKSPILILDPPSNSKLQIEPKWILVPFLPFAYKSCYNIFLCNLGIPDEIFKRLGMAYKSPFGSKYVIPLYHSLSS